MYVHSLQSIIWNRLASNRIKTSGLKVTPGDMVKDPSGASFCEVEDVTRYTVHDLYLPVVGYDTACSAKLESEIDALIKDLTNGRLDWISFREACKPTGANMWDLKGTYRQLVSKPADLKYAVVTYMDPDEALSFDSAVKTNNTARESQSDEEQHKYNGLVIAFSLPTSSYATMALRELLKTSTCPTHHFNLSKSVDC
jgi:tRNA pseudouridine13 synthase